MSEDSSAIDEVLFLIETAREDERKATQRLETAKRAVDASRKKIEAYEITLQDLRTALGVPDPKSNHIDSEIAREYQGRSLKEMLQRWADLHDDELVMREMSKTLTMAGLFKDTQSAAGALYSTLERMPGFVKISRGNYRRQADENLEFSEYAAKFADEKGLLEALRDGLEESLSHATASTSTTADADHEFDDMSF